MKTKILIVDDYNIFRQGLKLLLENHEDFKVVGEALNANDLFEILKQTEPDIIVMDLMLPQKSVIAISKKLNREYPNIPLLIITVNTIEYAILQCVINGARGLIWKNNTPEELILAIETIVAGERYFEIPESAMVSQVIQHAQLVLPEVHHFIEISDRELEVLKLIADGNSYKTIGEILHISPRTVESHKNNILSKLKLNSTTDLIKYAIKHQLIQLD
ncbi:response regulator [Sunxiuqinia sp. sy24]|uniref:response regulator n=1 Tax=Sunxiuqinia sp. sy24 TaxID=3461495 RepID=UPI0040465868